MKFPAIAMFLGSTALGAVSIAAPAYAQGNAAPAAPAAAPTSDALGDIVVTATRQSQSINRVPLSISAVSQETLTNQGVRGASDLSQVVPGVSFFSTGNDRVPQITIRGIGGSGQTRGAQTTGMYLDDTALQRRMVNGLQTGNGAPFPNLFDIERVEVLRGPQGTLYGDSSEGGTVRFITPTPSLTEWSGKARLDVSSTEHGSQSYEAGLALGGPIIEDKLAFRISGDFRHDAGWIDAKSIYDGSTFAKDTNWGESRYIQGKLLWKVTDTFKITPSIYYGRDYSNAGNNVFGPSPQINFAGGYVCNGGSNQLTGYSWITDPNVCVGKFTAASGGVSNPATTGTGVLTYTGVSGRDANGNYIVNPALNTSAYYIANNVAIAPHVQNAMPWYGDYLSTGNGLYQVKGNLTSQQYGSGNPVFIASPRINKLFLPSVTLDKDFGPFSVKSITSYVSDQGSGSTFSGGNGGTRNTGGNYIFGTATMSAFDAGAGLGVLTPSANGCIAGLNQARAGTPGTATAGQQACYSALRYVPGMENYGDWYTYSNKRIAKSEELRFSSNGNGPLTWVAGGFYSNSKIQMNAHETSNEDAGADLLTGLDSMWRGRAMILPSSGKSGAASGSLPLDTWQQDVSDRYVGLTEKTWAVFAEANYNITRKLKLTLGGRFNDYRSHYQEAYTGVVAGTPPGFAGDLAAFNPGGPLNQYLVNPALPMSASNPLNLSAIANNAQMQPGQPIPAVVNALIATNIAGCPSSSNCAIRYTYMPTHETNFTPKAGLSYQFTPTNMAYFTYTKGFRPGGANSPLLSAQCAQALANLGITDPMSETSSYKQDTVTSYEIGDKARILGGRVQLNTSAYYIQWSNMQFDQTVNCGFDYIKNAGKAVSKGAEIQASGRFGRLDFGLNVAYNQAIFAQNVYSTVAQTPVYVGGVINNLLRAKGDNIGGIPDWTISANGQYNWELGKTHGFMRADLSWANSYRSAVAMANTNALNIWQLTTPSTYNLNLRAGVRAVGIDWALYATNVTNQQPKMLLPGSSNQVDGGNLVATSIRPRTVGLQANYAF